MNIAHFHDQKRMLLFDVDGTLTDSGQRSVLLTPLLTRLRERGHTLGICTSQSLEELRKCAPKVLESALGPTCLFNGGLVLEDGHVWLPPACFAKQEARILTSAVALDEMERFKVALHAVWQLATDLELRGRGWGFITGISWPPVQLAPTWCEVRGSVTVWEKGPEITDVSYQGEYIPVLRWAQTLAIELGLHHTEVSEAGNGTLRLLEKGLNKGTALERLGFDLSCVVYIGNGANDIPAAHAVRKASGYVIAVANSPTELQRLAHYVTIEPARAGVIELLTMLTA